MLHHYQLARQRFSEVKAAVLMPTFSCYYSQGRQNAREIRGYDAALLTHHTYQAPSESYLLPRCCIAAQATTKAATGIACPRLFATAGTAAAVDAVSSLVGNCTSCIS